MVDGGVDFGLLDVALQTRVIRRVATDADDRRALTQRNAWLAAAPAVDDEVVAHNVQAIRARYSLARCGEELAEVYRQVLAGSEVSTTLAPAPGGAAVLDAFLDLSRFRPLRNG